MQEMQNGGVMIPQLNPLKFKLTQLFMGSTKTAKTYCKYARHPLLPENCQRQITFS